MKIATFGAAFLLAVPTLLSLPAQAGPLPGIGVLADTNLAPIETVQYRRGGFVARGPRGGVVAGRGVAVGRPAYRPVGPVPVRPVGPWVRPPNYWWRPGAAVAAGAAVGFVTAAAATAYVRTPAPAPGYCWYYTNTQRTQGFWDACP
ncbi:hypothetical protein [Microvirga zambiensis]|uniref:hypothetical protein n=1 Tax=Microvirga zambiensis TaxID=1402137 RepID=UPI00191E6216|nr:hypothetical protein [Microvirga zambiensis]